MNKLADQGMILQLQSFSVNDGNGIRTVIFMMGCPLRCKWCANPETWTAMPKLAFFQEKCSICGACRHICSNEIEFPPTDRNAGNCSACGRCTQLCPNGALTILGQALTTEQIVKKVMRDSVFFRNSQGGVTFSGGEPTFQEGLLRSLANRFYELGISMDIETCGYFDWKNVKDIFIKLDHVFFDLKHLDPKTHAQLTGVENHRILENCKKIAETNIPLTIRVPLIKDINCTEKNLIETAKFIKTHAPMATLEILPYHNFGNEKYRALGMESKTYEFVTPSKEDLAEVYALMRKYGIETVEYR